MPFFDIDEKIIKASKSALDVCGEAFSVIETRQEYHQQKMIRAFQKAGISESHFSGSTGYGYGDRGRDALDEVYAFCFDAEDALVRHSFASGTHALTVALFGVLRPKDTILSVTGVPYDTIKGVIGIDSSYPGSLKDFLVNYKEIPLKYDGQVNLNAVAKNVTDDVKMVYVQRSRGYSLRPSLTCKEISEIVKTVRSKSSSAVIMLDNCYAEFVEALEPLSVGADLIAGSLIKNPGGGIAQSGGYIAGKKDLVQMCAYRLTTPGTGKDIGATFNHNRELFMGAFHGPHAAGEALKTAVFAASLFERLGFEVSPKFNDERSDIIQTIKLKNEEQLIKFCRGIQCGSAVDSFVVPEPSDMPGYECKVIMAAGTFTLGSSIELSADAPLRPPFAVWLQGGLNFHSGKLGIMLAANKLMGTFI